jgi:hypothetical protein
MMNPIGIRDEDWTGAPGRGSEIARGRSRSRRTADGSGRHEGSGVEVAGMAERYWKELRPSTAGRVRLDAGIHHDQEDPARHLRRPRHHSRLRRRTVTRQR